jgi:hypothetical protein
MKSMLSREQRAELATGLKQAQGTLRLALKAVEANERDHAAFMLRMLAEQVEILRKGLP